MFEVRGGMWVSFGTAFNRKCSLSDDPFVSLYDDASCNHGKLDNVELGGFKCQYQVSELEIWLGVSHIKLCIGNMQKKLKSIGNLHFLAMSKLNRKYRDN